MDTPLTPPREQKRAEFEAVVSAYEGPLLRYCTRILRDADGAQDVVQDTFLRLFRTWKDELRPCPLMSSWLYRVAHNCAVDRIRWRSRRDLIHTRHAAEQPDSLAPDCGASSHVSDDAQQAVRALHALSLREQQLVILKVFEEKSYKEIGEITGLTVTNVGYILHFAMKKLAAELKRAKVLPDVPPPGGREP